MIKFWDYKIFYKDNKKKILNLFDKTLLSGKLILGNEVEKFERNFSKYIGVKYAVAVGNCTDAIFIALKVLNLKKGSEVITVSNTAVPTIAAINNAGLKPVFVDINDFYLMDENKIQSMITKKTKVILPVHLYGQVCNMNKINLIAKKFNLKVIEDCAQATGAANGFKKAGSFGLMGCFSFYPTKVLGGFGDGGMITTNNYRIYEKIKIYRFMGINNNKLPGYAITDGINSRMDDIQASILNFKLKSIEILIKKRNEIAKFYQRNLDNKKFNLPKVAKNNSHVYYEYVLNISNRDKLIKYAKKFNLELKITYPYMNHKMKKFKKFKKGNLIKTNLLEKKIFSLPTYPEIPMNDLKKIVKVLNSF